MSKLVEIKSVISDFDGELMVENAEPMTVEKLMKIYLQNLFTDNDEEVFEIVALGMKVGSHKIDKLFLENDEFKLLEKAVKNKKVQMNPIYKAAVLNSLKEAEDIDPPEKQEE